MSGNGELHRENAAQNTTKPKTRVGQDLLCLSPNTPLVPVQVSKPVTLIVAKPVCAAIVDNVVASLSQMTLEDIPVRGRSGRSVEYSDSLMNNPRSDVIDLSYLYYLYMVCAHLHTYVCSNL